MNKKNPFLILWTLLGVFLYFFPELAWADNQPMSFAPPPSDLSIVFLRDIFGIVDGVLAGGGSQILGTMFGIFNAAVLSLAGIVIIYTILVATVNTAGDGQVLGKNWSSVWIPIRTTIGISLLFTYSSGYSVLQIFFMWVVVQGVGAADMIWNAALGYLQKGGVLVQPIMNSENSMTAGTSSLNNSNSIISGTTAVLGGVTCLYALQEQLQTLQQSYLESANNGTGPCANLQPPTSSSSPAQVDMYNFCNNPVPNLAGAVDIVGAQAASMEQWTAGNCLYQPAGSTTAPSDPITVTNSDGSTTTVTIASTCYNNTVSVYMPTFPASNVYSAINGICGSLTFGTIQPEFSAMLTSDSSSLTPSQMAAISGNVATARAVAVQQVYSDMSLVAQSMVNNDLSLNNNTTDNSNSCAPGGTGMCYFYSPSYAATSPFGVPASTSATNPLSCYGYWSGTGSVSSPSCTQWASPTPTFAPLMSGTELQNAISDYNSVMEPSLNLMMNYSTIGQSTQFVGQAEQNGWIMAGSYLFNLANVNANDSNTTITDTYSYLGNSVAPPTIGAGANFCTNTSTAPNVSSSALCTWYTGNGSNAVGQAIYSNQINYLFGGPTPDNANAVEMLPNFQPGPGPMWPAITTTELNTTVYGYAANAANVQMPNQPGMAAPAFTFSFSLPQFNTNLPQPCSINGAYGLAKAMCWTFIGWIVSVIFMVINLIITAFVLVVSVLISLPMITFDNMFNQAASMFNNAVVSPVVVIANIGNLFINTSVNMTLMLGLLSSIFALTGVGGIAIATLMGFFGPILIGWIGFVFSMGVEAAYYIPMVPYIIFTFASFGWMVGVLEAMVAAPIVALGVCLPEGGHDVFGKGLDSLMLILGVFLRPPMMIIAFVAAYIMSSVGIWLINTGFSVYENGGSHGVMGYFQVTQASVWTVIFSQTFFFGIYMTLCAGIVTRSFELIYKLPDAIMKWIGGNNVTSMSETVGDITSQAQSRVKEMGQMAGSAIEKSGSGVGQAGKDTKADKDKAAASEKSDAQHKELMGALKK